MKRLDFVLNLYKLLASNLLGVVLVICGLELFLLFFYFFYDDQSIYEKARIEHIEEAEHITSKLPQAYPHLTQKEISLLWEETWNRGGYKYDLFCQFREPEKQGIYVNVSSNGYREVEDQGNWPPDTEMYNIFVFGGSTTFGYGVADSETIPSFLQKKLRKAGIRACVYNFGRGYFYSTQELMLFIRLINSGIDIDSAIFIDGLNDLWHSNRTPILTGHLEDSLLEKRSIFHEEMFIDFKISRFMRGIIRRIDSIRSDFKSLPTKHKSSHEEMMLHSINRFIKNVLCIQGIGNAFDMPIYNVLQPVPSYKYDLRYHLFVAHDEPDFQHHIFLEKGFPILEQRFKSLKNDHLINLSHIQHDLKQNLYVDTLHYNKSFNKIIADEICLRILPRLKKDPKSD